MTVESHLDGLTGTLDGLRAESRRIHRWGASLARLLVDGGRVLAAGNGGSAAEAQHLTAELVGRYRHDRAPFSALALCSETSSVTAIANDYGYDQVFARQITAHARPGDLVILLSTSGRSPNLLEAAHAARLAGARVWALTGPSPNPLASLADDTLALPGDACHVQEAQLVVVHALCEAFEAALPAAYRRAS
ncbi:phosphoheptose isomerase [Lentzea aerocolonigenes]|uniref:Phosphoheptose isomerase n=1 Tax=Lentzea aerocolonigenes TaxID=68170 RepID=A0A0F0GEQ0_LENAE|nr:SIS domain-containing protein [Lentzea aerocolonigenes]KJK41241.1 phosphoheptose isomerase [Lentzea aerocolonigenes]